MHQDPKVRPLFSIITATRNAAADLPRTLESVDEQTCRLYEHIIVDGLSTDGTLNLVEAHHNELRTVDSKADTGIYDAMNRGIGLAQGDYLIFLNAGDTFHSPDTLCSLAEAIMANDYPGVVYGQTILVDNHGRYLAPRHLSAPENLTLESFAQGMVVCHQAFVVLCRIVPFYNLKYRYSADYEWCILCLQHSRNNVYVPEVIIDYQEQGITTRHRGSSLQERFRIMATYYGFWPTVWRHLGFAFRFLRHRRELKRAYKNINND